MQYHNVQEYDGNFNLPCPLSDIDLVHQYNGNDTDSTCQLLEMKKKDIELRLAIEDEYGINVLNKDGVNIGMEIIKVRYLEETGLTWSDIKDLRSPCDEIDLNEIIFPFITFKTPVLQDLLKDLKQQKLKVGDNSFERKFLLGNSQYTYGVGGIHTVNTPEIFIADNQLVTCDVDVALKHWRN